MKTVWRNRASFIGKLNGRATKVADRWSFSRIGHTDDALSGHPEGSRLRKTLDIWPHLRRIMGMALGKIAQQGSFNELRSNLSMKILGNARPLLLRAGSSTCHIALLHFGIGMVRRFESWCHALKSKCAFASMLMFLLLLTPAKLEAFHS